MSEKIDWSKAPTDATHHIAENNSTFECWLKSGYAVRVSRGSSDWVRNDYADKLIADCATARPSTPSWSGEGLPPIGVEVEWMQSMQHGWQLATVLAYNGDDAWIQQPGKPSIIVGNPANFRPIRTPEQIAADERSKECDRMFGVILDRIPEDRRHNGSDIVEALYDAGCRLPKP